MFCLTIPSFIMNIEHCCGKGWCAGAIWYGGVIKIPQSGVVLPLRVPHILAEHHIWRSNRGYTLQYLYLQHIDNYKTLWLILHRQKACTNLQWFPTVPCYLLIPHVNWAGGSRFLHGDQTEHLEEMILHDISTSRKRTAISVTITLYSVFSLLSECTCLLPNDTKVIKVSSTTLSAKRLLEGKDHTGHTVPVPYGSKDAISKPGRESIKHCWNKTFNTNNTGRKRWHLMRTLYKTN